MTRSLISPLSSSSVEFMSLLEQPGAGEEGSASLLPLPEPSHCNRAEQAIPCHRLRDSRTSTAPAAQHLPAGISTHPRSTSLSLCTESPARDFPQKFHPGPSFCSTSRSGSSFPRAAVNAWPKIRIQEGKTLFGFEAKTSLAYLVTSPVVRKLHLPHLILSQTIPFLSPNS